MGDESGEVTGLGGQIMLATLRTLALILSENGEPLRSSEQRSDLIYILRGSP